MKLKNIILFCLKIVIAFGLVYWLAKRGFLDLRVYQSLGWGVAILCVAWVFVSIFLNNYRWTLLLRAQNFKVGTKTTLPLTLIGVFFNFAMPGGVGGDFVKGFYLIQNHPERKLPAAMSILVDRVVGLLNMALMALGAMVLNPKLTQEHSEMEALMYFLILLLIGAGVFLKIAFSEKLFEKFKTRLNGLPGHSFIMQVYEAFHSYRKSKAVLFKTVLISFVSQSTAILFFVFLASQIAPGEVTPAHLFWIVPIGLISTSLPISPGGVGVGQAIFLILFKWVLGYDSALGPNLITGYQLAQMLIGLSGVYFYLKMKKSIKPEYA